MKKIKEIFKRKLKTVCDRCTKDVHYPTDIENGLRKECYVEIAKWRYDKKYKIR